MTNHNDGGPAHPLTLENGYVITGMTLRDYFSAAALQGFLSADAHCEFNPIDAAKASFDFADAMLAERARREGENV